jgi:hypothetical protein
LLSCILLIVNVEGYRSLIILQFDLYTKNAQKNLYKRRYHSNIIITQQASHIEICQRQITIFLQTKSKPILQMADLYKSDGGWGIKFMIVERLKFGQPTHLQALSEEYFQRRYTQEFLKQVFKCNKKNPSTL